MKQKVEEPQPLMLPELAKRAGMTSSDDYPVFVNQVIDQVGRGELELVRLEQQGWSVAAVRKPRR